MLPRMIGAVLGPQLPDGRDLVGGQQSRPDDRHVLADRAGDGSGRGRIVARQDRDLPDPRIPECADRRGGFGADPVREGDRPEDPKVTVACRTDENNAAPLRLELPIPASRSADSVSHLPSAFLLPDPPQW
jgi:hypothetical protein